MILIMSNDTASTSTSKPEAMNQAGEDVVVNEKAFIKKIKKEMEIGLPPQCMGMEAWAVNKMLKKRRYQYCSELNGVLLRASRVEFLEDTGRIIDDGPFVYWKVVATLTVFSLPHSGYLVRSSVSRKGSQYIGCLLADCIDVTIRFDPEYNDRIERELLSKLSLGDDVIFKVVSFMPSQKYIDGIIDQDVLQSMGLL